MKTEILAPAGNLNALKVAIDSGADAVYLGASKFNARAGATNFTLEELKKGVEYAHVFGSKVYLTVNTIIKNNEMSEVLELIDQCVQIGVDAYIIQDMGLASCLIKKYENIELHASTQMAVHNVYGAKILENIGFKRVVLSRECSIEDIKAIKQNTNLEIEYFVHGALCVSFSGNCYFSSLCSACSGNRGKCKQFCRLPYSAYINEKQIKTGYLLSPSDQCLISKLQQLVQAGVNSFKIEGRLKKESYIASTVSAYKKSLKGEKVDINILRQIFSRGEFNMGKYCDLNNDNIINTQYNNHSGVKVGCVQSVEKFKDIFKIGILSQHNFVKGDAIKFYINNAEICSAGVGNVEKNGNIQYIFSKNKPKINSDVHLIVNKSLEDSVMPITKKLPLDVQFIGFAGTNAVLNVKCGEFKTSITSDFVLEQSKNISITENEIKTNLSKLNETYFELKNFNAKINNIFIAKSQLNELRRQAINKITNQILSARKPIVNVKNLKNEVFEINSNQNYEIIENIEDIINNSTYIFAPTNYSVEIVSKAVEKAKKENAKLYLDLPNIARYNDIQVLDNILNNFTHEDFGVVANNLYAFNYAQKFEIVAGLGLNIINDYAKNFYLSIGAKDVIFSIEANVSDISKNSVAYSFGNPVAMTLTHCPIKMLYNNTCSKCCYSKNIIYKADNGEQYQIRRKRIANCYFELVSCQQIRIKQNNLRQLTDNRMVKITSTSTGLSDKNI